MIISHGRRYIFVHIPKTGGTALSLALEARAMKDDILIGDTPKAVQRRGRLKDIHTAGRLWKHSTLADIDGLVSADELDGMVLFTLVRNPWDRLVSYYHWLREQSFDHIAVRLAASHSFDGFVRDPTVQHSIRSAPYGHYMRDATGSERDAHFIRLEHLAAVLAPVEAHLGFRLEVGRANTSARDAEYQAYYSDDTAHLVATICDQDIARFGYSF